MGMLFLPFGKNACSLLAYLLWVRKVAWQQMEPLRFSCVASFEATHFSVLNGRFSYEEMDYDAFVHGNMLISMFMWLQT